MLWFLYSLAVTVSVVASAFEPVDDAEVDEWAAAHGLSLTPPSREVARRYLSRVKRFRRGGAIAGWFLPGVLHLLGYDTRGYGWFLAVIAGYLVGIAVAELTYPRQVEGRRRAASLVPRDKADYLPRSMTVAIRVLALVSVALAPVYLAASPRAGADPLVDPSDGEYVWAGVGALAIVVAVEILVRKIIQRPQPVVADDLLQLDDAFRASSIHGVVGSGAGLILLIQSIQWAALDNTRLPDAVRATALVMAVACLLGAGVGCLYYGYRAWRVRHRHGAVAEV